MFAKSTVFNAGNPAKKVGKGIDGVVLASLIWNVSKFTMLDHDEGKLALNLHPFVTNFFSDLNSPRDASGSPFSTPSKVSVSSAAILPSEGAILPSYDNCEVFKTSILVSQPVALQSNTKATLPTQASPKLPSIQGFVSNVAN